MINPPSLSRPPTGALLIVLAVYAALSLRAAAASPLVYDEVYTAALSQFSSPGQLWDWLLAGTDLNPPLNYVVTHAAHRAFGTSPLATRLPSIAAFGGAILLTFLYLRRRHRSDAAGWLGAFALLACNLPYYSVVARSYALMVFWGSAALLLWHLSGEASSRPRRAAAAAGLLAALVAALYTHYYGVFLVLPIALAEAARLATAGRVNAFAAGSAAAALASAAGLLPLVRTAREFSAGFWRRPSWADLEVCYGNMLLNAALPVFFAAAVVFLARRRVPDPPPDTAPADRVGDWATVGYLVIPAAGLAVAMAGTGAFDKRYVVAGYLGAVGLFAGLTAGALRGDRRATGLVLAALAGWWLLGTELRYRKRCEEARQFEPTLARVRELAAAAPVYVTDPELFLTAAYACGDDRDRLVYPADPRAALEATGSDTDDRNLLKLATVLPGLTVRPFAECALPPGTVVIGTGWQVAAWGRAGHRFAPAGPVGPRSQAFRVLGPAGD